MCIYASILPQLILYTYISKQRCYFAALSVMSYWGDTKRKKKLLRTFDGCIRGSWTVLCKNLLLQLWVDREPMVKYGMFADSTDRHLRLGEIISHLLRGISNHKELLDWNIKLKYLGVHTKKSCFKRGTCNSWRQSDLKTYLYDPH